MNPAAILLFIQGLQALIAAAPKVAEIIGKAKDLITAMFTATLITKEQQDALHLHVDSLAALAAAGIILPHWQVEADPDPEP